MAWMKGCRFRIKPPYARYTFEGTIVQLWGPGNGIVGTWAMFDSPKGPGTLAPLHLAHAEHLSGCGVEHQTGASADQIIVDA